MNRNQTKLQKFEFFNNLDTGVMKVIIPFLVVKMDFSMIAFGFALGLKPLMDLIFRYISSYLSDQFGRKNMAVVGQMLGAFALLGYVFVNNVYHFMIVEILRALSAVIFEPSYNAWKKESCENEQRVDFIMKLSRNRIFGTAVGGTIAIIGSLLLRVYKTRIFGVDIWEQHFFLVFFIFELFAVILLLLMSDSLVKNTQSSLKSAKSSLQVNLKESVYSWNGYLFMLFNAFALAFTSSIALPFTAVYMTKNLNLSMDKLGVCFIVSSVLSVFIAQKWVRKLKYGRPFKAIGILLLMEGITSCFIPLANEIILFTLIWCIYLIYQTSIDVLYAAQEQRIIKANTAQILQILGISASIGIMLGANLGGIIWNYLGSIFTYWVAGFLILSLGLVEIVYDFVTKDVEFSMTVNRKTEATESL